MYGWRKRLGLIVPSANTANEPEFYDHLPDGVSVHTARMAHTRASVETQSEMDHKMERCAEVLCTADVDVLVFGCTTGSLVKGAGHETEIETRLSEIGEGIPAVATAASVLRAFEALGIESVAVSTPYPEELDEREAEFLEESGYEVTGIRGLGLESAVAKADVPEVTTYRKAEEIDDTDADGVFISCTNSQTFDVIEPLEGDLGKPIVTSNQATLWDALRAAGVDYSSDTGPGALFER